MNNQNQAILPRRSRRLATIIPAAHWMSMGYTEEVSEAMEKLQTDMKKYYDGTNNGHSTVELVGQCVVLHHDMMIPHWEKFAVWLGGRNNVQELRINKCFVPSSMFDIILLSCQSIVHLVLGIGFGNVGMSRLSSFLTTNSSLQSLGLSVGKFDDESVVDAFSDAIKNHRALKKITFCITNCDLDSDIFRRILEGCSRLKSVGIGVIHEMRTERVFAMAEFIASNHPVEAIDLANNKISDSNTLLLASSLRKNTCLRRLVLNDNNITDDGLKGLTKALFDAATMDSIVESNHTCAAFAIDQNNYPAVVITRMPNLDREILRINGNNDISTLQKVRKKVVLALCGVNGGLFDLSYFNSLPLELMPRVLQLLQEHSEYRTHVCNTDASLGIKQLEKDALTRLFHTLRGWELPLLFENLSRPTAKAVTRKRKRRSARQKN